MVIAWLQHLMSLHPVAPKLFYIGVLLIIAVVGVKIIDQLTRRMKKKFGDKMEFKVVSGLMQVLFLAVIIVIMLSQIGVSQEFLRFFGLIITGIIAFSSQSLIANLVSGFIIHITRPFYKGDIIQVGDVVGKVIHVKSVYTEVYTFKKTRVEVPNATFIQKNIINYSEEGFRINIPISLGYDVNRVKAEDALLRAAKINKLEDVFVAVTKLDNSFIVYELNGTSRDADALPFIESQLNKTIIDEFNGMNVEIASPMLITHAKTGSLIAKTDRRVAKRKEREDKQRLQKLVKDTFETEEKKTTKRKKPKKRRKQIKKKNALEKVVAEAKKIEKKFKKK